MWIGIEMAIQIGTARLVIERDSKTLVDMLLKEDKDANDTSMIVKRIWRLLAGD